MTNNDVAVLNELADAIYKNNVAVGWYDVPREDGTLMMLMVSEIAEAMEGVRKNLMDAHLPHRKMVEVELADAMIRILDYCGAYHLDIGGAIMEKLEYNKHRQDHKREARLLAGGKTF